ncbi:hypothetical protein [Alloprevotella tannerae]|uniref:hypothetical protein n=1 Tax=Alloprevotella tannerae TaxID=76122 RepID=UPI00288A3974|nr:hypothetical protein [Alloprevotella tannerae]
MEKKKTYVLMLSAAFPKTHINRSYPTYFKERFLLGQGYPDCAVPQDLSGENSSNCNSCGRACFLVKLHTIRANYPLWEKRVKEIQAGNAVLSIRQWSGKQYRSKQVEIARLTAEDGVGIQKLCFPNRSTALVDYPERKLSVDFKLLAKNDGLSLADWCDWFRYYDLSKPLAIIHFTNFRY